MLCDLPQYLQLLFGGLFGFPDSDDKSKTTKIHKDLANVISFKTSHTQQEFKTLTLGNLRKLLSANKNTPCPKPELPKSLYSNRPNLSGKYRDLHVLSLCKGSCPEVAQQDLVDFYKNLPHEE